MPRTPRLILQRFAWIAGFIGCLAVAGMLTTGLGRAQDRSGQPVVQFAAPPTFADVFEQVGAAVVDIQVTKGGRVSPTSAVTPFPGSPFEGFLDRFGAPDGLQRMPSRGMGSGFIIDPSGFVATNYHVVAGASTLSVTLATGEMLDARVVGTDERTDLALIKVESNADLPFIRLGDSDRARVGDWVLAIGNPFGLGGSATAGIISARGRDIQSGYYDDYLQIDAPINSGNSGGPVFNAAGEVIGINTAIFSPTGGNVGIGFAIPSNQARGILEDLRENGSVNRGWLGVSLGQNPDPGSQGVVIARVEAGGPADAAGLRAGDLITRFDGAGVDSPRTLARLVGERDAGESIDVEILRDGDRDELTVELGALESYDMRAALTPDSGRFIQPYDRQERFYRR